MLLLRVTGNAPPAPLQAPCGYAREKTGSNISISRLRPRAFASIGFSTDPRIEMERAATGLLKDVAMLLVYQEVFSGPPAQAFLRLLLAFRRRDDSLKILEAYGEFFKLMATGKHQSWEDFILEGILIGEGNPFAEAAAYSEPRMPVSLEAAAVSDLESLQRLSVTESTLSGWVAETVSDVKPEWRRAASSNLSSRTVAKLSFLDAGFAVEDSSGPDATEDGDENHEGRSDAVVSGREKWRKQVGGLWKWSDAVPLLKQYHREFGCGKASAAQVVKWKGGKPVGDFGYLKRGASSTYLSVLSSQHSRLSENIKFHLSQQANQHMLLHGQHGTGKSWLVSSVLSKFSDEPNLRVLLLSGVELKNLASALDEARKSPCLRFVLVIDDLFSRTSEDGFILLKVLMEEDWPRNVVLCATSTRSEIKMGDKYVTLEELFHTHIELSLLDEKQYFMCVDEMVKQNLKTRRLRINSLEVRKLAAEWGQRHTILNLKRAAQFVESILE